MPEPENTIKSFVKDANPDQVYSVLNQFVGDFNWEAYKQHYADLANVGNPLTHYFYHGHKEKRVNVGLILPGSPQPQPGPGPQPPTPPTPHPDGLSLVLSTTDGKECFCALEIPEGLLVGRYGLHKGGADIMLNGKVEFTPSPERESFFQLFRTKKGRILATIEHYASVFARDNGVWACKYKTDSQPNLALGICQTDDGRLWVLWNDGWTSPDFSVLICSDDDGETWHEYKRYPGLELCGICADGNDIFMAGANDKGEVLVDINGNVLMSVPNGFLGYQYWPVISANGVWNVGTWNASGTPGIEGFINVLGPGGSATAYGGDNWPFCQAMTIFKGVRYAVFTWGWEDSGKNSALFSSVSGLKGSWKKVVDVPCAHIMGVNPGTDGLYLCGGRFGDFGRVYFYKV